MMKKSIYKSPEGEAEIHAIYDQQLDRINLPFESCYVDTQFGLTHVLVLGPKSGEPILVLQGGNTTSPLTLNWIRPIMEKYRVYAPDTIGHPGKSSPNRLSPRNHSYGIWLEEVMDALKLKQPILMGGSFGAGILLRTAIYIPERIKKAILFIPSGLVSMPTGTMMYWIFWLMIHKLTENQSSLKRILQPMFLDEPIDQDTLEITEAVFRLTRIEKEMPRNVTPQELKNFNAPTLVIAAERDALFSANKVIQRAQKVFPNLVATDIIAGATHYLSPRFHPQLNAQCIQFLEASVT
jgi:pimeloyl-ACP methyl ester carboxylesterase